VLKRPHEDLVKLFSSKPFDFEPGEEMIYNNSAFFLLGLVIEKVSGKPYDRFVQENLFDRVGMPDSYYCSERAIHNLPPQVGSIGIESPRNYLVNPGVSNTDLAIQRTWTPW